MQSLKAFILAGFELVDKLKISSRASVGWTKGYLYVRDKILITLVSLLSFLFFVVVCFLSTKCNSCKGVEVSTSTLSLCSILHFKDVV